MLFPLLFALLLLEFEELYFLNSLIFVFASAITFEGVFKLLWSEA